MNTYEYPEVIEKIHPLWLPFFEENKEDLKNILDKVNKLGQKTYPNNKDLFRALFYHSPKDIKLCIIGQDCYINEEDGIPQAMGLCFSVPKKYRIIPPSLKNIFKEIKNCYPEYEIPKHGLLKRWARVEKMLLLNAALTVKAGESNSHAKLWNPFTDKLIKWFQNNNEGCVFLLMGNYAKSKGEFIDKNKHKIFVTVHPSPLSAERGFFGCKVFKEINDHLKKNGEEEINW